MSEIETARQGGRSLRAVREGIARQLVHGYAAVVATPWSNVMLGVSVRAQVITSIDFLAGNAMPYTASTAIAREAVRQLRAYFDDPYYCFSLPLEPRGTPFQQRVWDALGRIPSGEIRSYGALAHQLGSGPRAIGGACRANPIPVVIPCHRVVAAHGMGGFMGMTTGRALQLKQHLLTHELLSKCRS